MTSVQFEWGDNFRVKPNELVYLLIEGTKIEDSYLTFMRNCILGGDNFRAFRVDLGGQNSKGDNFQLYHGYGSDRIFLSISGLVKKYTEHCLCNPSKNWGFEKQRPKCPSNYSCTLWKCGKNFKRKSDSNSHKKFQQLWEFAMIRFSVRQRLVQKLFVRLLEKHYGSVLWQEQIPTTRKFKL